jgi:hypothetical protein
MFKLIFSFSALLLCIETTEAAISYQTRGHLSTRLSSYTKNNDKNYGQQTRAQLEQVTQFLPNLTVLNQLRWTSNSISSDLATQSNVGKKENYNVYLGENYFKFKSSHYVLQAGYQEVVWGEAFGLNYADIINPKDGRETLYSDAGDARLPLLLFNGKTFFTKGDFSGSLQFLASPEPRFSKALPIEVYAGPTLTTFGLPLVVEKESTPKIFKKTELGGKLSISYNGLDTSLFTYKYFSRDPYYEIRSLTPTLLVVKELHSEVQSYGFSFAKTIYDFVFRTDIVQTQNRKINYIATNGFLLNYSATAQETLISLDTPSYYGYSGVFIFANSSLNHTMVNSFREKNEQYAIGKISKDLGNDIIADLSYTHEFLHSGHSIQSSMNWPINSTTDLKIGGQFYFGEESSNLNKLKNVSSVFFSLKNYFQL